jgi:predicted nucleic acid-binding protein
VVPFTFVQYRASVEIDDRFADLGIGLADASVMALAEGTGSPILTFDFAHFRATAPARGFWRLVVDEAVYARAVDG